MYHDNFFHNFDHATHVTQSVIKLLTRVVTPKDQQTIGSTSKAITTTDSKSDSAHYLHEYTFGITSDPLTQFAVVFSALIHDVDHPGVPNSTLVSEKTEMSQSYKNKSVAEQNSVDLAWEQLGQPCYADLRACIFSTDEEYYRFRSLVVNTVMATDIVDKELASARRRRWEDAFSTSCKSDDPVLDSNRKATIVIEHLIQASDVSHTMQHWHVYLKWNERFFHECYQAYSEGRSTTHPGDNWYEGELGFFDFYVIPLAKKLQDCGVFGVSSDEYLNYAVSNRGEWESKGKALVQGYLSRYEQQELRRADEETYSA